MEFDSNEWRTKRNNALKAFLGDDAAVEFFIRLGNFTEVIDDLVDQDKTVNHAELMDAMHFVLCDMPFNRFYQSFSRELRGQMAMAINSWFESNRLQRSVNETDRAVAFVLRDLSHEMLLTAGVWLNGVVAMQQFPKLRDLLTNDSFTEYRKE